MVVCGVWEGSTKMSAVSYAWGKIHQVLVWGKCQSTCLILFGPQTCSRPLYSPKGISCQQLLLFIYLFLAFNSQILQHIVPSYQMLVKHMIYYHVFLLSVLISGVQVAMTKNWDVMLAFHPDLASCEQRLLGHTDFWFHGKGCQRWEVRGNKCGVVCVCQVDWPWETVPVQGIGRGRNGFSWSRYIVSQPHMASATAAVSWNRSGLFVKARRCPLTQTTTVQCTSLGTWADSILVKRFKYKRLRKLKRGLVKGKNDKMTKTKRI